jgi:hypothetical protein
VRKYPRPTWVSDKTLIRLAAVLETEIWSLFLPDSRFNNENSALAGIQIVNELRAIKKNFDTQFLVSRKILGSFIEKSIGTHGLNNVAEHPQTL